MHFFLSDYDSGDTCDTDYDGDGINDDVNQCLGTVLGDIVNDTGCSIADLCPCDNEWKNHGKYVSYVTNAAKDFVEAELIAGKEKGDIVSQAAQSSCGKTNSL